MAATFAACGAGALGAACAPAADPPAVTRRGGSGGWSCRYRTEYFSLTGLEGISLTGPNKNNVAEIAAA